MAKQKKGSDKYDLRIAEPLSSELRVYVEKKGRTISAVIRDAVSEYLAKRKEAGEGGK